MEGLQISSAMVVAIGDPSVGIPPTTINIEGPMIDLGTMAEEDRAAFLEETRRDLESVFGDMLSENVTVVFDFEIAAAEAA